jgi:hypothetical protein
MEPLETGEKDVFFSERERDLLLSFHQEEDGKGERPHMSYSQPFFNSALYLAYYLFIFPLAYSPLFRVTLFLFNPNTSTSP